MEMFVGENTKGKVSPPDLQKNFALNFTPSFKKPTLPLPAYLNSLKLDAK